MKQLTLRGFDKALEGQIRRLARSEHLSLNRAAMMLLRRGAGLDEGSAPRDVIGHSLDAFMGDWTEDEAQEFERAISVFESIDEDAWK